MDMVGDQRPGKALCRDISDNLAQALKNLPLGIVMKYLSPLDNTYSNVVQCSGHSSPAFSMHET